MMADYSSKGRIKHIRNRYQTELPVIALKSTIHDPWGEIEVVRVLRGMYIQSENEMFPGEYLLK